jgi:hypothetical protein
MAVTVSGNNTVSISIADSNAIAVNVGQVQQSGVSAYGGIGPTLVVSGTHTAYIGTIGINPFVAGPNITITQSAGNITFSGRNPQTPTTIVSVTGGDGDLVTLADDLDELNSRVSTVDRKTLDVNTPSGRLVASGAGGRLVTASSYVSSVMGRTGTVTLTTIDITGANGARCAFEKQGATWADTPVVYPENVTNRNDFQGSVVVGSISMWDGPAERAWFSCNDEEVYVHPNYADSFRSEINAAPASHSHGNIAPSGSVGTAAGKILVTLVGGVVTAVSSISTAQITNFTATAGAVKSVNGKTGDVVISQSDIESTLGNSDLVGDLAELNTTLDSVSLKFPPVAVPANRGLVSSNDGPGGAFRIKTSSGFVHTLNACTGTVTLVGGTSISITPNATSSRITISYTGDGGGGPGGGSPIWPALILGG